jgi:hypothetical protein
VLIDSAPHEFSFRDPCDPFQLLAGRNRIALSPILDNLKIQQGQVLGSEHFAARIYPLGTFDGVLPTEGKMLHLGARSRYERCESGSL